ncbi:M15 family metallopeptidase [Amphibacillus jilinensis]|uniref:M15 family metallopeptidase n=1 Tax=Amphibacillus jilinensis TaxID=1216008 RepID=UPI0002DF4707|nr:M15 family metallopeptidase [Amphibacillus jilinensis]
MIRRLIFVIISLFLCFLIIQVVRFHIELNSREMPDQLHPIVAEKKDQLIDQASDIDIDIVITDGFRSVEEQNQLYQQGRATEGSVVTYAQGGESYHNYGLAIDFALQTEDGEIIWDMQYDGNNSGAPDWFEVVDIAKSLGFTWGGDWDRFPDYPHLQFDDGLSIQQLQRGYRPGDDLLKFIFFID